MNLFSEISQLAKDYKKWLDDNPQIKDCALNVISYLEGVGRLKDNSSSYSLSNPIDWVNRLEELKGLLNIEPWEEKPYIEAIDAGIVALQKQDCAVKSHWVPSKTANGTYVLICFNCGYTEDWHIDENGICENKFCPHCGYEIEAADGKSNDR